MRAKNTNEEELRLINKWTEKAVENGKPKKRHVYGQFRKEDILSGECAVFVADEAFRDLAGSLSESVRSKKTIKRIKTVAAEKSVRKSLKKMKLPMGSAEEALAKSEFVIALGGLPVYFAKRDGQKVIFVSAESDAGMPREQYAIEKAASLLNATETICFTGDPEECSKAITDALDSGSANKQKSDKKRMLIVSDNNLRGKINNLREMFNMASFLSEADCELTIFLPSGTEDISEIRALRAFPENVKLVIKKGPLACSVEDYIHTHLIIDRALPADDIVRDVFTTELIRVLGRTDFDSVICFGEISTYTYYLLENLNAGKKLIIETTLAENQISKSILERLEAEPGQDWIICPDPKKVGVPYCCSSDTITDTELKEAVSGGACYCALGDMDSPGQLTLQLLLWPAEGEDSLIAYGDSGSAGKAIESFAGKQYQGKKLYLYGGDPAALHAVAEDNGVADRVEVLEKADIHSYGSLGSYLKRFGAYLAADKEEYNEIGDLMHRLGKPAILADTGTPADISWDSNRDNCRARMLSELF